MLLLAAVALLVSVPSAASAATVPTDPRITAAVAAWKNRPVYVDPQYTSVAGDDQVDAMSDRIRSTELPVFVAVVSSGDWFQEKGDAQLLAGWLAHANGKPGIYLVMDGDTTYGATHLVRADGPTYTYARREESMDKQLSGYLNTVRVADRYEPAAARTKPHPPTPERTYTREPFTVGKAIAHGFGGLLLGLFGGALVAGCVLGLAALVARRGGGRL
jgi:hypothetical protein